MFPKEQKEITYKGKKFTVEEYSVSSTINLKSRIRRAKSKNDENDMLEILIDMATTAIVKPKLKKEELLKLSEDDLVGLTSAAVDANGFMPGEDLTGKKPSGKAQKSKKKKKS